MANTHNIAVSWRDETQRIGWPKFPGLFRDGVKIDATTESHTTTAHSQNETAFGFSHNGGTNVKAVLVFVFQNIIGTTDGDADYTEGVTYGGVSMDAVAGARAVDTGAETGAVKTYLLNDLSNINQGKQQVTVFRTNNDVNMYAVCITLTADNPLEVTGIRLQQENQVANAVLVTDGFSSGNGTSSLRFAAIYSGDSSAPTANSGQTILQAAHNGSNGYQVVVESTPGMGERLVGVLKQSADDWAAVYLAVREQNVNLEPARRQEGLLATLAKPAAVGAPFSSYILRTYAGSYTVASAPAFRGAIVSPRNELHFIPYHSSLGQKLDRFNTFSTYSLIYTTAAAYTGGVLAPNGDIHFVPYNAVVGQKISANGAVSTYSLVHTSTGAYWGGVLAPNGDIHFVPYNSTFGQKVAADGTVSTYSLVYTNNNTDYVGGVVAPNGDIHFIPHRAAIGQKVAPDGTVSTYSLVYTTSQSYHGGVLAPNGDIHMVPYNANRGQKIDRNGVVSTYSLAYTSGAYMAGVLAPNGDIHFIPFGAEVGEKISIDGVISTYPHPTGGLYLSAVYFNDGIYFIPSGNGTLLQKLFLPGAKNFNGVQLSPYLNKV